MNPRHASSSYFGVYLIGILGSFLIVAGLVWVLRQYTRPAPLNQARVQERLKNLRELNAQSTEILNNYAWQDASKGIVRLPIDRAIELVLEEWKNPALGRSNLLARLDKANPPPPPKAPEA